MIEASNAYTLKILMYILKANYCCLFWCDFCCRLPVYLMWISNQRAGWSRKQRTCVSVSGARLGSFPAFDPPISPCTSLGFPGQECERASSLPPQGGFSCMRFNWLSWTVCQRSGQRSAYVARKCQIILSNVCLCVFGGTELRDWKNDFSNRQFRILTLLIKRI